MHIYLLTWEKPIENLLNNCKNLYDIEIHLINQISLQKSDITCHKLFKILKN